MNSAAYLSCLETARSECFREIMGVELTQIDTALVALEIEYIEPIGPDEDVELVIQQPELGESSLSMEFKIENRGEVASTAGPVQVA